MSEHIFDALTRYVASSASRRGYTRALTGLALAGVWSSLPGLDDVKAKKGRKRKKKRNKNKKDGNQATTPTLTCTSSCAGKVCGDDGCGGSCGSCGPGQLCAQGRCVMGTGTCQAGDDICTDAAALCGGRDDCYCYTSMAGQTRCGRKMHLFSDCDLCTNDTQCAALFPDIPGVFCFADSGDTCECGGRCVAPCPL
jgi:hypothetical protein